MTVAELPLFSFFKEVGAAGTCLLVGFSGSTPIIFSSNPMGWWGFFTVGLEPHTAEVELRPPDSRRMIAGTFEGELLHPDLLKYWGVELKK